MDEFEIIFYDKPNGEEPAKDFIMSLDNKMQARVLRMVNLLGECGNRLRKPYQEYLEDGIFELRAKVGSDISRVLYFFVIGKQIVLLKRPRKRQEAKQSLQKKYRNEYLNREELI